MTDNLSIRREKIKRRGMCRCTSSKGILNARSRCHSDSNSVDVCPGVYVC